ncbi:MAG: ATP-grasp domain-containing protein [Leptospiraceae bacterium]|nr:ATP-grasp domain-containing protein [Leptospiraceae bacterium]MCP5501506.1 ATP-grasp domain-containing protein [Leptospiraceae bacterium]
MAIEEGYFVSIGGGKNQLPLIQACRQLGLKVITIDKNQEAPGFKYSEFKIIESTHEYRKIYSLLSRIPLHEPIIAVGCRSYGKASLSAAYISEKLNLPGLSYKLAKDFLDKKKIKEKLKGTGIKLPRSYSLKSRDGSFSLNSVRFPCIIKPRAGSGKKGVVIVRNKKELKEYVQVFMTDIDSFIVEDYISGKEVTVMGFCSEKQFHLIAVIDKYTTTYSPFLEISHRLPSSFPLMIGELKYQTALMALRLGMKFCPVVAEFRINSRNEAYLIEIVPEVGGEYLAEYLLKEHEDYDYFQDYVRLMLGKKIKSRNLAELYKLSSIQTQLCFLAPDKPGKYEYISSEKIDVTKDEKLFLDTELQEKGSIIETSNGNQARFRVIGLKSNAKLNADDLDKTIRERAKLEYRKL